jgi:hypothetical protein
MPNLWITDWADGERSMGGMTSVRCLDAWLQFTDIPPLSLGVIPANTMALAVYIDALVAFDGADPVEFTLGYDGEPTAYMSVFDIGGAGPYLIIPSIPGIGTCTAIGSRLGVPDDTARLVVANWTPLVDPTQGEVHIAILFVEVLQND